MKVIFTILCVFALAAGCGPSSKIKGESPVTQGITGQVTETTGNQMPSPDEPSTQPKALETTVYIYEGTNLSQVDRIGTSPFYSAIRSRFIQSVQSDKNGRFTVALPPGNYSLFTKVGGNYYANSFDSRNNIALVTVEENRLAEVNLSISARASY